MDWNAIQCHIIAIGHGYVEMKQDLQVFCFLFLRLHFDYLLSICCFTVGTFGVYVTGLVLDWSHQDWSIVWYMNAAVNVLGALAFIGLYDAKREFE